MQYTCIQYTFIQSTCIQYIYIYLQLHTNRMRPAQSIMCYNVEAVLKYTRNIDCYYSL